MPRRSRPALLLALVLIAAAGCSSPEKGDIVVAEIEDRTITLDYFERKMNAMDPRFVPGDINTQAGREELLDIMINKEVMALKADQLGMDADGSADEQAQMLGSLTAVQRMREDVVASAQNPTEEQLLDYYELFPRQLTVSYMLFDWEEDAWEAKQLVEGGEAWQVVAKRLKAGTPNVETNDYTLTMNYGTIADDLEFKVFQLPTGEVSEPIDSVYGWFLIRVDDVTMERVAPFEEMREKIRESVIKQDSALLVVNFIDEIFEKYDYQVNDEALRILWESLPDDASLSPPTPKENLEPLDIDSVHFDKVLVSYGDRSIDLREYQSVYNGSSVFARPRLERGLGNLRRQLKEDAVRELMPIEAAARGYLEDPVVMDEYKNRREQAMVTRLHAELVKDQVRVEGEEVEAFWAENSQEWERPNRRRIMALVAANQADALSARIEIQGGTDFGDVVKRYCIDSDLKNNGGAFGTLAESAVTPFRDIAWDLQDPGDVSPPVEISADQWAVVRLEEIVEAEVPTLEDVRTQVANRVKAIREEELFLEKVAEWRDDYDIRIHPQHLMKATYAPEAPASESIQIDLGDR